jgi:hypothetical protein
MVSRRHNPLLLSSRENRVKSTQILRAFRWVRLSEMVKEVPGKNMYIGAKGLYEELEGAPVAFRKYFVCIQG